MMSRTRWSAISITPSSNFARVSSSIRSFCRGNHESLQRFITGFRIRPVEKLVQDEEKNPF